MTRYLALEGPERSVNTTQPGSQRLVDVISLTADTQLALFADGQTLRARTLLDGAPVGNDFTILANVGTQFAAAALGNGEFAVAWRTPDRGAPPDLVQHDLMLQTFDAVGNATSTSTVLVSGWFAPHVMDFISYGGPSIEPLSTGGYVVGWRRSDNIVGLQHSAEFAIFDENDVEVDRGGLAAKFTLAGLNGGRFLVSWKEEGLENALRARILSNQGQSLGSQIEISASADAQSPVAERLPNDGFAVVWREGQLIRLSVYGEQGGLISSTTVNQIQTGSRDNPDITVSDRGFLVSWQDSSGQLPPGSAAIPDLSGQSIHGRFFSFAGAPLTAEFRFNTSTPGDQTNVRLTTLANGDVLAVWDDASQQSWDGSPPDTSGTGIKSQIIQLIDTERDLNADGFADVLWRNSSNGQVVSWELDGDGNRVDEHAIGAANLTWQIADTVDINGDGTNDILWRNTANGQVAAWQSNESFGFSYRSFGAASLAWEVAATADFNGDGRADILWRNTVNGTVAEWRPDATFPKTPTIGAANLVWDIADAGDVNGDGRPDILWRNTANGTVAAWLRDGAQGFHYQQIGAANSVWEIQKLADFNDDGTRDILWRNSSNGAVSAWLLDPLGGYFTKVIGAANLAWEIADAADFSGDGGADILWRNTNTGQLAEWEFQNGNFTVFHDLGSNGAAWQVSNDGNLIV